MTDRDGEDQAFVDAISEWPDINDGPTLAGFLLARIAEDEAKVRGFRTMPKGAVTCPCGQPGYVGTVGDGVEIIHAGPWSPPYIDGAGWIEGGGHSSTITHVFRGEAARAVFDSWPVSTSTTRVLAECEAKRRIIDDHDGVHECGGSVDHALGMDSNEWVGYVGCDTLRYLALPYADHPEYQEAWRP